jgi:hypothetical protein
MGLAGTGLTKAPASHDSPDFSGTNNNTASSSVGYQPTPAPVNAAFAIFASPKLPECASAAFTSAIEQEINIPAPR